MSRRTAYALFLGDLLALAFFVVLGLGSHAELAQAGALQRFLLNFGPLALAWTAVGWALGAFRVELPLSVRAVLGRALTTWLVAAPLALLLRAILLGAATIVVIFMIVTLVVGGGLLLLWRAAFVWLVRRAARLPA
jgi:hypothetical protein